jgi:hypothetical protein
MTHENPPSLASPLPTRLTVHRSVPSRRAVRRGFLVDRRAFLGTVAGGLLAAPLAAEGQQTFSGSCQAICF